jgi:hypothetical protein
MTGNSTSLRTTLVLLLFLTVWALGQNATPSLINLNPQSFAASFPAGSIMLTLSPLGCPAGFQQQDNLSDITLRGTTLAAGNVGTLGGSNTVAATFTGTPGTVPAEIFTGSSVVSASSSAGTPAGTVTAPVITWPAGVPTFAGSSTSVPGQTISWPAGVPTFTGAALAAHAHELPFQLAAALTTRQIAAATFGTGTSRAATASANGSNNTTAAAVALSQAVTAGTPAGTIAWPAGVPTNAATTVTPAGTISWPPGVPLASTPAFSGSAMPGHTHTVTAAGTNAPATFTPAGTISSIDTRSAFIRVIYCTKM